MHLLRILRNFQNDTSVVLLLYSVTRIYKPTLSLICYNLITEYNKGVKMKEDYKDYVYLRIPKSEYNKIINGEMKVTKNDIENWRFDYELKQSNKTAYAKRANKIKTARIVQKIYKVLENYYTGLFKQEKELTAYKLSKLAKINYRTAQKFFKEHNLDDWIKRFEKDPQALKEFKVKELSEYFVY